jgi:hypothetical protein
MEVEGHPDFSSVEVERHLVFSSMEVEGHPVFSLCFAVHHVGVEVFYSPKKIRKLTRRIPTL